MEPELGKPNGVISKLPSTPPEQVQTLALPLAVTLAKWLNLSKPQFLPLQTGIKKIHLLGLLYQCGDARKTLVFSSWYTVGAKEILAYYITY